MAEKPRQEKADECFYGTATVGERGQIVIPADLRKDLAIQPGDKLMIMTHPSGKGIMLLPITSVREFMNLMLANLEHAERAEDIGKETMGKETMGTMKEEERRMKDEG